MGNPVVHFEIVGNDSQALQRSMMPPDRVPGGPRVALFKDPEGHVVGLVQNT
jgi:hypothetical protein